jgi:hypothetical protein
MLTFISCASYHSEANANSTVGLASHSIQISSFQGITLNSNIITPDKLKFWNPGATVLLDADPLIQGEKG